jgi:2-polyprenyl-3-methyl-5-hydroxy-6-metoxy-1,4-benzoquinol methylase
LKTSINYNKLVLDYNLKTTENMASAVANLRAVNDGNKRFNQEALSWDSRPFVREASQEAEKAITAKSKSLNWSPKQVLEIGCGTGIMSFLIAPHVERVVAIDAAEGMIEVLKQKLQRDDAPMNILPIAVLLEDPEDPNLPPAQDGNPKGPRQKFDLITSHLVLHHIPDLKGVLKTMLGCLAPGGRIMLTDFEDFGPEARRFHAQSKLDGVERHGINAKQMADLLDEVGFVNVSVKPEWTMTKTVENTPGEFGAEGKPESADQGEKMDFPFVICYGEKSAQ